MKRALLLLLGAAAIALPSHVFAQAASTQKPAAPAPATAKPAAPAAAAAGRVIEIIANDQMKFDKTTIEAKAGEKITIRLKAVGSMPKLAMGHNFVLLKAGAKADTFSNEAIAAGWANDFIPPARKGDVIAHTKTIGGGETAPDITFTVPPAGSYTFLCSFNAHFAAGMKGTLVVK